MIELMGALFCGSINNAIIIVQIVFVLPADTISAIKVLKISNTLCTVVRVIAMLACGGRFC